MDVSEGANVMPRAIREDEFKWLKPLVEWERDRLTLDGLVNALFPDWSDKQRATAGSKIKYWLNGRLETVATWRNRQIKTGNENEKRRREDRALPNELAEALVESFTWYLGDNEWEDWEGTFPWDSYNKMVDYFAGTGNLSRSDVEMLAYFTGAGNRSDNEMVNRAIERYEKIKQLEAQIAEMEQEEE
jgi:hypothetical protein